MIKVIMSCVSDLGWHFGPLGFICEDSIFELQTEGDYVTICDSIKKMMIKSYRLIVMKI